MIKPITPMTKIPSRQILTDSQISLLPGFLASLNNREHDLRNDFNPKVTPTQAMPIPSEIIGMTYLRLAYVYYFCLGFLYGQSNIVQDLN